MERKTLLAVILSVLFVFGWTMFIQKKQSTDQTIQTDNASVREETPEKTKEFSADPSAYFSWNNDMYHVRFNQRGGVIDRLRFKKFNENNGDKVELISTNHLPGAFSLYLGNNDVLSLKQFRIKSKNENQIVFVYQGKTQHGLPSGLEIEKVYTFDTNSYMFTLDVILRNRSASEISIPGRGKIGVFYSSKDSGSSRRDRYNQVQLNYAKSGDMAKVNPAGKIKSKYQDLVMAEDYEWCSLSTRYFMVCIFPSMRSRLKRPSFQLQDGIYSVTLQEKTVDILKKGEEKKHRFYVYAGPRDRDTFREYKKRYSEIYGLISFEKAVGVNKFILPIMNVLMDLLNFFYRFVKNYGLAIILMTIVIKIVFSPFTYKQYESMGKMKKLHPAIQSLKEQYKDDPQKLNTETMALYKKNKVNPIGGCLPMVFQIPVFLALFNLLSRSIKLRGSSFLWIKDLAVPDTVAMIGSFHLNILPIAMAVFMFLQQKMTSSGDTQQQKMMAFLPFIFLFFFWNMPSGLVLYWTVQSILTVIEQTLINRHLTKKQII